MNGREEVTAQEAVDRIEAAVQPRPHDRRLHARGEVYEAVFEPSGLVSPFTTAKHLRERTRAVVRFSNGSGSRDADDRERGIRGMAVKFLDGDTGVADLVAANFRVFPSRNPEGFVELVEIISGLNGPPAARARALGGLLSLLRRHPESRGPLLAFVKRQAPASFARCRYDGLHAFLLVDAAGNRTAFRYRLLPQLAEQDLSADQVAGLGPRFLTDELRDRLRTAPVEFTLAFQFAEPGDPTDDPARAWPENRKLVSAGRVVVTAPADDQDRWEKEVFDPMRLPEGVAASDDPVLAFRPRAYSISAGRRLS